MSLTKVASIAGAAMIIVLGGTFLITQIMVPAKRFEACVSGGVVGGVGGSMSSVDPHCRVDTRGDGKPDATLQSALLVQDCIWSDPGDYDELGTVCGGWCVVFTHAFAPP